VRRARGKSAPVYIGDSTRGKAKVRTLQDQVALETRSRSLNPKFYDLLLEHGHEGVRQIEAHITNTMGWSATTGEVQPWIYQRLSETFVLDPEMRERLASQNPKATMRMAGRLLEASDRQYWQPDAATLTALQEAANALEDRIEGVAAE
jgi:magnesium chelatase subunit H